MIHAPSYRGSRNGAIALYFTPLSYHTITPHLQTMTMVMMVISQLNAEGRLIPGGELANAEIPSADCVHWECRASALGVQVALGVKVGECTESAAAKI